MERLIAIRENKKVHNIIGWMISGLLIVNFMTWMFPEFYLNDDRPIIVLNLLVLGISFLCVFQFRKEEKSFYIFLILFLLFHVMAIIITESSIGIFVLLSVVYGYILVMKEIRITSKQIRMFLIGMSIPYVYWIIYSTGILAGTWFYVGYMNPNLVAMMVVSMSLIYFNALINQERVPVVLLIALIVITFFVIVNSSARGSLLAFGVFTLLEGYFFIRKRITPKQMRIIWIVIFALSLIIPAVMVFMFRSGQEYELVIFGKPIYTGREVLWNQYYKRIKKVPIRFIRGFGTNFTWWKEYNLHNDSMFILQHVGIMGWTIFSGIFYSIVHSVSKRFNLSSKRIHLFFGVVCLTVLGYIEVANYVSRFIFVSGIFWGLLLNPHLNFNEKESV